MALQKNNSPVVWVRVTETEPRGAAFTGNSTTTPSYSALRLVASVSVRIEMWDHVKLTAPNRKRLGAWPTRPTRRLVMCASAYSSIPCRASCTASSRVKRASSDLPCFCESVRLPSPQELLLLVFSRLLIPGNCCFWCSPDC